MEKQRNRGKEIEIKERKRGNIKSKGGEEYEEKARGVLRAKSKACVYILRPPCSGHAGQGLYKRPHALGPTQAVLQQAINMYMLLLVSINYSNCKL